ncbi:hypothetical protein V1514DRAFT_339339 [Lipomyces japonicus]|uniref:uncharacterized protein n=1 Tax=Lipomyces japonicus TaxID=56871 RepID=UPI0034CFD549
MASSGMKSSRDPSDAAVSSKSIDPEPRGTTISYTQQFPPRRRSSVKLQHVPSQVILPLVDRPAELLSLTKHNCSFFNAVRRFVGDDIYLNQLSPLLNSSREAIDDSTFMTLVRRYLCLQGECSSRLWVEFCQIVGFDETYISVPLTPTSPTNDRFAKPRSNELITASACSLTSSLDSVNDDSASLEFASQDSPFSFQFRPTHKRDSSDRSIRSISPSFTCHDPIAEE